MAKQCGHIKANGQPCRAFAVQGTVPPRCSEHRPGGPRLTLCTALNIHNQPCRGRAIAGSDPPRCPVHRQDGGPALLSPKGSRYGALTATHGFYRKLKPNPNIPKTLAAVIAQVVVKHEQLSAYIDQREAAGPLPLAEFVNLYQLHALSASRLMRLLRLYHQLTGRHPDQLLAQLDPLKQEIRKTFADTSDLDGPPHPKPAGRSPKYWQIYHYICAYIAQHGQGPTNRQIVEACHLSSKGRAGYWLERLAHDGLIIRAGANNNRLSLPPDPPPGPHPVEDNTPCPEVAEVLNLQDAPNAARRRRN
jgi:hypothetical protein